MPPDQEFQEDIIRVRHMLDAAREAVHFSKGKVRKDLDVDRVLALALIKDLEMIGEAASKMTPDFQLRHPEIPWKVIIGMRIRLVHVYFDIDLDIVWKTIDEELPNLVELLEEILNEFD